MCLVLGGCDSKTMLKAAVLALVIAVVFSAKAVPHMESNILLDDLVLSLIKENVHIALSTKRSC